MKHQIHVFNRIIRIWGEVVKTAFKYRPGGPERPTLRDISTRSFKQSFKAICINCYNSSQIITHFAGWKKKHTHTHGPQNEMFDYNEWEVLNGQIICTPPIGSLSTTAVARASLHRTPAAGENLEPFPHHHPSVSKCQPPASKQASHVRETWRSSCFQTCSFPFGIYSLMSGQDADYSHTL